MVKGQVAQMASYEINRDLKTKEPLTALYQIVWLAMGLSTIVFLKVDASLK